MIIIYCSKPQQTDAVTPTPLAHRNHTCMRALALGHDTPPQGSRGAGPTSTRCSLSLILDNAGPGKTFVKPSANMNLVPIPSTVISSNSTASITLISLPSGLAYRCELLPSSVLQRLAGTPPQQSSQPCTESPSPAPLVLHQVSHS